MAWSMYSSIVVRVFPGVIPGLRAIMLLLASTVLLSACGSKEAGVATVLAEGSAFPEIVLNFSEGKTVSTQSFRGKVLVLNFWATWCPPCRKEMPGLEALSRSLDPARFAVVGVSADEDAFLAEEFLRQNQITFANFFDRGGKIAKQLGMQVYPETFLIGADGILLQRVPGLQDWNSPAKVAQLEELSRATAAGNRNGARHQ
ncbi:TlpA disulfide reductase family protein [Noviherbaspirillum sp. UKPF54]|uniref:TlpA family protein disulfide reductase n=1 Tax=Noviherbaspirillum sp. UKPF54 TaxID=2601898 RepID=UPI0011B13B9B|nr:TlpA disulfide reductase family protein [Noviherbaspirillum sp. UKPF54]QDZ27725.1 TlpA family protein disulfide reductase [Noviherbaspirillum sp. UKPF54]